MHVLVTVLILKNHFQKAFGVLYKMTSLHKKLDCSSQGYKTLGEFFLFQCKCVSFFSSSS